MTPAEFDQRLRLVTERQAPTRGWLERLLLRIVAWLEWRRVTRQHLRVEATGNVRRIDA